MCEETRRTARPNGRCETIARTDSVLIPVSDLGFVQAKVSGRSYLLTLGATGGT